MTEISFVDRFIKDNCSMLHGHSRKSLMTATESLMGDAPLTLNNLGRRLQGNSRTKHKIERVDHMLCNARVHAQRLEIYRAVAAVAIKHCSRPIILVDRSDFEPGHRWLVLRASLAMDGRALTLYGEVHLLTRYNNGDVHRQFLHTLQSALATHCQAMVVTDAGFRGPWFKAVRALGWHFVGGVRIWIKIRRLGCEHWQDSHQLYEHATARPVDLGAAQSSKKESLPRSSLSRW